MADEGLPGANDDRRTDRRRRPTRSRIRRHRPSRARRPGPLGLAAIAFFGTLIVLAGLALGFRGVAVGTPGSSARIVGRAAVPSLAAASGSGRRAIRPAGTSAAPRPRWTRGDRHAGAVAVGRPGPRRGGRHRELRPRRRHADREADRRHRRHRLHRRRQRLRGRLGAGVRELLRPDVGPVQGPDPAGRRQPRLAHPGRAGLSRLLRRGRGQ